MQMTCPKCHGAMRQYERSGVTVDQCGDCRGIFLDLGELEHLITAQSTWQAAQAQHQPQQQPSQQYGQQQYGQQQYSQPKYSEHRGHDSGHHSSHKKKHENFFEDLFG